MGELIERAAGRKQRRPLLVSRILLGQQLGQAVKVGCEVVLCRGRGHRSRFKTVVGAARRRSSLLPTLMSPGNRTTLPSGFKLCLLLSAVLHAGLIAYGDYQDAHSTVRYTDVDYLVFSDAAGFVWRGEQGSLARDGRTTGSLGSGLGR